MCTCPNTQAGARFCAHTCSRTALYRIASIVPAAPAAEAAEQPPSAQPQPARPCSHIYASAQQQAHARERITRSSERTPRVGPACIARRARIRTRQRQRSLHWPAPAVALSATGQERVHHGLRYTAPEPASTSGRSGSAALCAQASSCAATSAAKAAEAIFAKYCSAEHFELGSKFVSPAARPRGLPDAGWGPLPASAALGVS